MNTPTLKTERLILRKFTENDTLEISLTIQLLKLSGR